MCIFFFVVVLSHLTVIVLLSTTTTMETITTLRAVSCDTLTVLNDSLVAAGGAKKTYYVDSRSDSTTNSVAITVPAKSAASHPLAAAGTMTHEPLLLVASSSRPNQLDLHRNDESNSSVVENLLSVDAPSAIQFIYVRHNVVIVQSDAAGEQHAAFHFYRLDTNHALESGSLRHLGSATVPVSGGKGSNSAAPLWLVEVSAAQVGVQEAVIAVTKPAADSAASGAHIALVDISGTIASQRASLFMPLATTVAYWTVNWSRRELLAVFGDHTFDSISLTTVANRTAVWSSTRRALPAGVVETFGICSLSDGSVWIAAAASSKANCTASLLPLIGQDTEVVVPIGSGPVSSVARCGNDIYVLQGKKILRHRVPEASSSIGLSSSSTHEEQRSASSVATQATSAETLLRNIFVGGASSATTSSGSSTSAAAQHWLDFLQLSTSSDKTKSPAKRPATVLRDADFVASHGHHHILDVLLAASSTNKNHSNKQLQQDAVLRYIGECVSVEASTLIRIFSYFKSAALQLAVWSLVSLQCAQDASALEHLCRQHIAHLRQQSKLSGESMVELFLCTCDAVEGALDANLPQCVSLGAALADAIVVVHGKPLLELGGQPVAQRWSSIAASLSSLSAWALEWAAPAMGQITAHCGAPLHASKEAQFIASNARRIRTTKEADIHRSTIVLEAPSVTRANKRQ